jgi:hypothetical protein
MDKLTFTKRPLKIVYVYYYDTKAKKEILAGEINLAYVSLNNGRDYSNYTDAQFLEEFFEVTDPREVKLHRLERREEYREWPDQVPFSHSH